jgi:hypothetical protein
MASAYADRISPNLKSDCAAIAATRPLLHLELLSRSTSPFILKTAVEDAFQLFLSGRLLRARADPIARVQSRVLHEDRGVGFGD